jgi:iron transport multicopper oxidase
MAWLSSPSVPSSPVRSLPGASVSTTHFLIEQSFTYQFSAQGQTGTYWYVVDHGPDSGLALTWLRRYHSHYSTQYCDGLRGPLIIYDPYASP